MSEKTEVQVESMRVSLTNQNRLILLKEKNGPLSLPLFIGQFEAEAIVLALQDIEISRPQPHDLIRNVVKALDAQILSAEITEMRSATFIAEIILQNGAGNRICVDCRPSDAVSVALRAHAPIYVRRELMDAYGIQPEQDIRTGSRPGAAEQGPDDEDLSAFKDFFDTFDNK